MLATIHTIKLALNFFLSEILMC